MMYTSTGIGEELVLNEDSSLPIRSRPFRPTTPHSPRHPRLIRTESRHMVARQLPRLRAHILLMLIFRNNLMSRSPTGLVPGDSICLILLARAIGRKITTHSRPINLLYTSLLGLQKVNQRSVNIIMALTVDNYPTFASPFLLTTFYDLTVPHVDTPFARTMHP